MKFSYRVHSVTTDDVELDVENVGKTLRVKAPALVIELVSDDGSMSHTIRKVGASDKDADGFVAGATVNATFTVAKGE